MAEIRINPATKQVETLTPEGIWSASALEQQVGGIQQQIGEIGKEVGLLTDLQAQEAKNKDLQDLATLMPKEEVKTKPIEQPKEEALIIPKELMEETPKTEVDLQVEKLTKQTEDYDRQINDYISNLDSYQSTINEGSQALIENIKQSFEARRNEQREINRRLEAATRTATIRWGGRYTPLLAEGIISAQENAGLRQLERLSAEENSLIQEALKAKREEDFGLMHEKMELIRNERDRKDKTLTNLLEISTKANEEIAIKREKFNKQLLVNNLIVERDITDPIQLFNVLNFDSEGNVINDIIMEEINEVLQSIPSEEIKIFDNLPYRTIKDSAGKIISYEKIPGIESAEDIKTFGGMPYKAVKNEEGNIISYEKISGVEAPQMATPEAIDNWVDLLVKGQTQIYNIPMNIRNDVVSRAAERGLQIISPTFAKAGADAISSYNSAISQLNLIATQSQKVITATSVVGIPEQAAKGLPGVRIAFPEYKIYKDSIDAFLSMLTRAAGERGVLTNIDVGRIKKALPDLNSDTIYTATEKLKNFRGLLESIKSGAIDAYTAQQFGITPKEINEIQSSTNDNDYIKSLNLGK